MPVRNLAKLEVQIVRKLNNSTQQFIDFFAAGMIMDSAMEFGIQFQEPVVVPES